MPQQRSSEISKEFVRPNGTHSGATTRPFVSAAKKLFQRAKKRDF
jgi:hypothetical protein